MTKMLQLNKNSSTLITLFLVVQLTFDILFSGRKIINTKSVYFDKLLDIMFIPHLIVSENSRIFSRKFVCIAPLSLKCKLITHLLNKIANKAQIH